MAWDRARGFPLYANAYVSDFDALTGDRYDRARAAGDYRAAILDTPAAAEVRDLKLNYNNATRTASPTFRARFQFDDIEASLDA